MPPIFSQAPVQGFNFRDIVLGRFLGVLAMALMAGLSPALALQSVTLAWDPSPSPNIGGYKVYYRTAGSTTTSVNVGNVTTGAISNLADATTYYFSVSAYDTAGLEGPRSSEIAYTTPSPSPNNYTLTVNSGSGDGSYPAGAQVVVTADSPPSGQRFDRWLEDYVILANPLSETTTATIPLQNVSITATYVPLPTYSVTVTNGSGDGSYLAGASVAITADPAPAGQQFAGWTGNVTFANASSSSTTFTMPPNAVAVTANYTASAGTGTGLRAEYYNDSSSSGYPLSNPFTGSPVLTRTDATVDFDWGGGSPAAQVSSNFFSVKWTGQVKAPVSGSYTFSVTADDGVRLFLNGVMVIDGWKDQGATSYSYTTTLTAGTLYNIELQYYEHEGNASCRLRWSYPGQSTQTIPHSQLFPSAASLPGTGLRGQYYNDSSNASYPLPNPFAGSPVLVRTDSTVDFDWGGGSPASQVTSNFFSVKWTGQVKAPVSGTYSFLVTGDDGVRLFINGNLVIDGWRDQGPTPYVYAITLTAGALYNIELHYYEHEGDAACKLRWSYPGQPVQVIPQSQLYPSN